VPDNEPRLDAVPASPDIPDGGPAGHNGDLPDLWRITRRRFLTYAAATGAAAYAASAARLDEVLAAAETLIEPRFTLVKSFSAWARRRDDLLSIRFDFYNLIVDASDPANPRLVRKVERTTAYIVAVFWPQNVAEQAILETSSGNPPDPPIVGEPIPDPPVRSILARETRLAFAVPDEVQFIPYRLEEVLKWTTFKPNVVPVARLNGPRKITDLTQPSALETALELPWRLVLSPHAESRWKHATAPVMRNDRTELWHTRLVVGKDVDLDEPDPAKRTLRAVWARDPKFGTHLVQRDEPPDDTNNPDPFRMSLNERDRFDIVLNSSTEVVIHTRFGVIRIYTPVPIKVDRLMLSALGAWIDSDGRWEGSKPLGNSLEEWRHRGTMGRDHYVRIVRKGYLYPYGHPASLIKITERKFNFSQGGTLGAYLRQRFFIVVRRPDKAYSSRKAGDLAPQQPFDGRMTPFRNIRFTTLVTPPLDSAGTIFVPMVGGKPFLFHAIGTDWGGLQAEFTTSVRFVDESSARKQAEVDPLLTQTVTAELSGQKVNLAEIDEVRKVDTAQEIQTITFGGDAPTGGTSDANLTALVLHDQPGFYPSLCEAKIRLAAAEQVSGGTFSGTVIRIAEQYRKDGFDTTKNKGQLYAVLESSAAQMRFPADKSGGVMTPNLDISGLSRLLGPVADHNTIASGQFKPAQVFTDAKLMGGLKLADIVQDVNLVPAPAMSAAATRLGPAEIKKKKFTPFDDDDEDDDANTLALKITRGPAFEDGPTNPPTAIVTKIKWKPPLKKDPLHIFEPDESSDEEKKGKAVIKAKIRQDLKVPTKTDVEVKGKIENFKLNLFGDQGSFHIMTFEFNKLEFTAATGKSLEVNPDIEKVTYFGILKFVEKLQDLMSVGPFSFAIVPIPVPPAVEARASLSVPELPPIGPFKVSGMKFTFICSIPFTDKPIRFRFDFCTRDHPFLITVYIFGGGGYFGIALGTDGFEVFEAALEFGAACSLNLGIASGSASVRAGIFFKLEEEKPSNNQKTTLEGYFKANGSLSVLGFISVSIELYLGLKYESDTKKVTGTASLHIEVSVLFFSISVTLKVERKFGGTGDPSFLDMHDQSSWKEYADAFAA